MRKIANEDIVAALLTCGTRRGAAQKLGCSERLLYLRMQEPEFVALFRAAKDEAMKTALTMLQSASASAVATLANVLQDPDASPQTRINAAAAILTHANKLTETVDVLERLETLENEK